ncbi:MAG: glycosyltransferase family 2 protein [Clostridia bacterium]|nr:glycosyltransferase family 2 protein [Clostridia bacterium]
MVNVLLPSMGTSVFFKDVFFPKPLYEIEGKTMLELMVENYQSVGDRRFIFVFSEEDCQSFHLDLSVKILEPTSEVIRLRNQTAGALCTCLMAVDFINNDTPLIIANSDQIIDVDYSEVLRHFDKIQADAGIITFPSIHPRWSYAKKQGDHVIEVEEKRPLSRDAIAGLFYYKKGSDYVKAAKQVLVKQNCLDGKYYISASMNELILMGKKVGYFDIDKEQYGSFYSPAKIEEYEARHHMHAAK